MATPIIKELNEILNNKKPYMSVLHSDENYYRSDFENDFSYEAVFPVITAIYFSTSIKTIEIVLRCYHGKEQEHYKTMYQRDDPPMSCILRQSKDVPTPGEFCIIDNNEYVRWMPTERFFCGHFIFNTIDDAEVPAPVVYEIAGYLKIKDLDKYGLVHKWIVPLELNLDIDKTMELYYDQEEIYERLELLCRIPKTNIPPHKLKNSTLISEKLQPQIPYDKTVFIN